MGAGPVTGPQARATRPSWRLKPPHDSADAGHRASAASPICRRPKALFLCSTGRRMDPATAVAGKGAWLQALEAVAPITDADGKDERARPRSPSPGPACRSRALGDDALATFSAPFREGMYQEDRLRRLGDRVNGQWQATVIDGGPRWSANTPVRKDERRADGRRHGRTPDARRSIDADDRACAAAALRQGRGRGRPGRTRSETALAPHNVRIVAPARARSAARRERHCARAFRLRRRPLAAYPLTARKAATDAQSAHPSDGQPATRDPWHGVPLGEILLGHTNAHHEKAPGPMVPDDRRRASRGSDAGRRARGLPQLRSRTAATWWCASCGSMWPRSGNPWKPTPPASAPTIRARRMSPPTGSPNGSSAATSMATCCARADLLPPDDYNQPQNAFGFMQTDPHGIGCPLGSHVRRANPRDSLAQRPGLGADLARRREQPPHPAARAQIRHHGSPTATRTTARSADCCSSA